MDHQLVEAAKLEVAAEDAPDPLRLDRIDGDLAVSGVIAEGRHAAHPKALALGGRDLVSDALGSDLTLELRKGQQDVEGQPPHRGGRIELLGDGDKRHIMLIEQFDQLGEVRQRAGQAVDLVDDDHVDLVGPNIIQEPPQGRTVGVSTREAAVIVFSPDQGPACMGLAANIGL